MPKPCTHHPLTTLHLSTSWCSRCQHWLAHWSQSGRRTLDGDVVLIEVLTVEALEQEIGSPDEAVRFAQRILMASQELEEDRADTDTIIGYPRYIG